jgi:hypothetical protein
VLLFVVVVCGFDVCSSRCVMLVFTIAPCHGPTAVANAAHTPTVVLLRVLSRTRPLHMLIGGGLGIPTAKQSTLPLTQTF